MKVVSIGAHGLARSMTLHPERSAALDLVVTSLDTPITWVMRPMLERLLHVAEAQPARRWRPQGRLAAAVRRWRGHLVCAEGVLYVSGSANQERTIGSFRPPGALVRPARGPFAVARAEREALAVARDILARCSRARLDLPPDEVLGLCLSVARYLALAPPLVRGAQCVVVATQHQALARALTWTARDVGVPSIYVPHAPLARNDWYYDLPVDHAALRGHREVHQYLRLGARPEGLHMVGNPAVAAPSALPAIDPRRPPVVALSPWPAEQTQRFLAVCAGGLTSALVAPHPRSDLELVKALLPQGWADITSRRTFDVLQEGPPLVVQASSGVAWEALVLGIPVVDLADGGYRPNYLLHEGQHVVRVTSAEALSEALRGAVETADDEDLRAGRRSFADSWCGWTGDEAVQRIRTLIRSVARGNLPGGWVLDGWRAPAGELMERGG